REGNRVEIVELGGDVKEDDLLFHDERTPEPALAFLLSRLRHPEFPEPMGVFRAVERTTYDGSVNQQVEDTRKKLGDGDLEKLLNSGDTWYVT
ncbi:MAG TPA: 2-oxoacid:ferredoxin oxidoreductase subunit beta, partial [Planctomycetaceae bacterium]|nr:2-oxoacid:ferredoxin oxidoreductase subunit beta [Planctomycetaceae bacterium]